MIKLKFKWEPDTYRSSRRKALVRTVTVSIDYLTFNRIGRELEDQLEIGLGDLNW